MACSFCACLFIGFLLYIKNLFQNLRHVDRSLVLFITAPTVNAAIFSTVDNDAVVFRVCSRIYGKYFHVCKLGFVKAVDVKWCIEKQGRYYGG